MEDLLRQNCSLGFSACSEGPAFEQNTDDDIRDEEWLGFPDLWSGQKPRWNWYLTPMVNLGEVRRAQLAKSTPHLQASVPGIFSHVLRPVQMLKREWVRKTTGSYRTYSFLVKLQPWFLSLRWKVCLWAELPRCLNLQWRTCPRAEHSEDDYK